MEAMLYTESLGVLRQRKEHLLTELGSRSGDPSSSPRCGLLSCLHQFARDPVGPPPPPPIDLKFFGSPLRRTVTAGVPSVHGEDVFIAAPERSSAPLPGH